MLGLPAIVGSDRLKRARQVLADGPHRFAGPLLRLARATASVACGAVLLWFAAGVIGIGQFIDEITFKVFDADSFAERMKVLGLTIGVLASPLLIAAVLLGLAWTLRAVLWIPARIARAQPVADILGGLALAAFLTARAIAVLAIATSS